MKTGVGRVALLAVVLGGWAMAEAGETNRPPPAVRLELELVDGSRIIGIPKLESLPVQTTYARVDIPCKHILTMKLDNDRETATLDLINGDKLRGVIALKTLELATALGPVKIGIEHVLKIRTSVSGGFNAAAQFSGDANPSGVWSYGWCAEPGAELRLYEQVGKVDVKGIIAWTRGQPDPQVFFNTTDQLLHPYESINLQPKQLAFHPGQHGVYSVIRWTAPAAGVFTVSGKFEGISGYGEAKPTTTDVQIRHGADQVFASLINLGGKGNSAPFRVEVKVARNATIDFLVGRGNGDYTCDSTALDASIIPK
jgi:hypothetical protein